MSWTEYKIVRHSDEHVWRDWTPIPAGGMSEIVQEAVQRYGPRIDIRMRGEPSKPPPFIVDFMKETS